MIRFATIEDANDIASVHISSWRSAYKGLMPDDVLRGLNIESRTKSWRKILSGDATVTIVAEMSDIIVGFSNFGRSREPESAISEGEILAIYLVESHWSKGIGGKLLARSLEELRNQGYKSAMLWVLESNTRAIEFYSKYGFVSDGNIKIEERPYMILREQRMIKNTLIT